MARSVNKVILIGNLGADPDLRYTPSGTAVCNARLATNESYTDQSGQLIERTEWHNLVFWGKLAELCGQYLKKGSRIYVEGSLQTRSWEDKEGVTRYTTEIKVRDMMMLDGRGGDQMSAPSATPAQQPATTTTPSYDPTQDDLPF